MVFEKNANFCAENCRKSQKIVIITSSPGANIYGRFLAKFLANVPQFSGNDFFQKVDRNSSLRSPHLRVSTCDGWISVDKRGKAVSKMSNVGKRGKGVSKNVKPGWKTRMRNNPTAVSNILFSSASRAS
jgi:hypothetical protein